MENRKVLFIKKYKEMVDLTVEPLTQMGFQVVYFNNAPDLKGHLESSNENYFALVTGLYFEDSNENGLELLEYLKRNSFFGIKHRALWTTMADTYLYQDLLIKTNAIPKADFELIQNFSEFSSIIQYFKKIRGVTK